MHCLHDARQCILLWVAKAALLCILSDHYKFFLLYLRLTINTTIQQPEMPANIQRGSIELSPVLAAVSLEVFSKVTEILWSELTFSKV